jgi:formylglycine-generating enzyme required for sulfatase activity
MVLIPSGQFLYGQEKSSIDLPAFYIDRYEVSQAQYARFLQYVRRTRDHSFCNRSEPPMKRQTSHTPLNWGLPHLSNPRFPVVGLDYWDAYAYAHWVGKRLPSEEEWEKAARGTDGRTYPWGDEWDPDRCNWGPGPVQGYGRTLLPVDSMPDGRSPYGCYHMLGNAAEWTDSYFDEDAGLRAGRGFCWRLGHMVPFVVTFRMQGPPFLRDDGSGLRCALDAPPNATTR